MDFSPETLRARFAELAEKRDRIRARADPLREQRDRLVQAHAAKESELNSALRKAEAGLFELDQETATIARALGGKTG